MVSRSICTVYIHFLLWCFCVYAIVKPPERYFVILPARGGFARSSRAFLFSLKNQLNRQFKMLQYRYTHRAIWDGAGYGPIFGNDLQLSNSCHSNTNSYANPGSTYREPTGHGYQSSQAKSLLAGSRNFRCDEYEVFYQAWRDFSSVQRLAAAKRRKTTPREYQFNSLLSRVGWGIFNMIVSPDLLDLSRITWATSCLVTCNIYEEGGCSGIYLWM